jgi:hypothetical protein
MDVHPNAKKLLKGATGDWEIVIGMEVHAQVTSNAKLFSGAPTEFGGAPNSHVSLVDAAMPGMLPVINEECVRQAIRTGEGVVAARGLEIFDHVERQVDGVDGEGREGGRNFSDYAVIVILHAVHICLLSNGKTMGHKISEPKNCFAIGI